MDEKKTRQGEAIHKSAETKSETKPTKAVRNAPLIRRPSIASAMLAQSLRRFTYP